MKEKIEVTIQPETFIYAIARLVNDVVMPAFDDRTCKGYLDDVVQKKHISREAAALEWMEKHFEAVESAAYAIREFVEVLEP